MAKDKLKKMGDGRFSYTFGNNTTVFLSKKPNKKIKNELYAKGYFQLQFSIHSTDEEERKKWLPKNIWNFEEIQNYGNKWSIEQKEKARLKQKANHTHLKGKNNPAKRVDVRNKISEANKGENNGNAKKPF